MNIGIFFGSTTGNTEDVAEQVQEFLAPHPTQLHNIATEPVTLMQDYDLVICGIPTWDYGELQADWEDIWDELDTLDLSNTHIAIFGCGDQIGYPEWYQDAVGMLHDKLCNRGALAIGYWSTEGYKFEQSKAVINDSQFVGLAVDEDNQHELTEERVSNWCQQIIEEYLSKV